MAYVEYSYYTDTYKGFKVPSNQFDFYAERATESINENISNPPLTGDEITDEVKKCTCAVVDQLYSFEEKPVLKSEKVGSYQRSFETKEQKPEQYQVYRTIVKYLGKTGLLYRGVEYV